ncbi:MAG: RAMP superfamily CRISPR-associated protein [Propionibacteriaceae bacterium]|nr:hypothetical protein [Micropruina sp.]HBX81086.1 hypothetical protein [Propionibacteriaceae bacterium]HBY22662.1 hypothetical protein [Propionibacteriaceae bacterium]
MTVVSGMLTIRFDSDWHCGSGQARYAGFDRTIARDVDGLPFVPAKTVLGLWRDACEKAANGLDEGPHGAWNELVRRIFGSAGGDDPDVSRGRLYVEPARLPEPWRAHLRPQGTDPTLATMLRSALTVSRYGVAINNDTGVAEDDTLRLIEYARAGLSVETPFHLEVDGDTWALELLLQAGVSLWHHTGSHRRRGAGACQVTLTGVETPFALLAKHTDNEVRDFQASSVTFAAAAPLPLAAVPTRAGFLARHAEIVITTLAPVLCAKGVQGNVLTGHDMIPGATILPIIARALGDRATGLIRGGHLVVTDATVSVDGRRAAPMPKRVVSGDKGRAWHTTGVVADAFGGVTGARALSGWCVPSEEAWLAAHTTLVDTAHASISDDTQRPDADGFYTFEAIPAGVILRAEVWGSEELSAAEWQTILRLPAAHSLGRYRRGDFGAVHLTVAAAGATEVGAESVDTLDLWLTSDAYVLDQFGNADPTLAGLAAALGAALSTKVTPHAEKALLSVVRRESWTATQALPRLSLPCVAGGSVARFTIATARPLADIEAALRGGIGERRTEGFGQVRLLTSPPTRMIAKRPDTVQPEAVASSDTAPVGFDSLLRSAWRAELRRRIQLMAGNPTTRRAVAGPKVTTSQLGALRESARQLPTDADSVARWVTATRFKEGSDGNWGKSLDHIVKVGGKAPQGEWASRIAAELNALDKTSPAVPSDLGGVPPQDVAVAYLCEVLAEASRDASPGRNGERTATRDAKGGVR